MYTLIGLDRIDMSHINQQYGADGGLFWMYCMTRQSGRSVVWCAIQQHLKFLMQSFHRMTSCALSLTPRRVLCAVSLTPMHLHIARYLWSESWL
jgi:hypothetical protein